MKKVLEISEMDGLTLLGKLNFIKNEILSLKDNFQPKEPTEYITASELRELLKISKPTEMQWRRKGVIKAYKMGGRTYYKQHEIESVMKPIKYD